MFSSRLLRVLGGFAVSSKSFLLFVSPAFFLCACSIPARAELLISSPNGKVAFHLSLDQVRLRFRVTSGDGEVIGWSPMSFSVDGVDLANAMELAGDPQFDESNTTYPTRGVHSTATNHYKSLQLELRRRSGEGRVTIEARAFDDGVAFRFIAPGEKGKSRTPDERTTFEIPAGSIVWHANLRGHYEGDYHEDEVSKIPAGEWVGPPMTFKLPGDRGYA
jgi:alpha-glucosidase